MFDEEVFGSIRSAWKADQNHPNRSRLKLPIPSVALLKELLESAFVASLKREEGRELSFALCIVPEKAEDRGAWLHGPSTEVVPFSRRIPMSAESISKLATACDPSISALLVDPTPWETGNYGIWGMMYYGPPLRALTETSVHISGFSCQRPDVPTITATSPGSILISRGQFQIGRFVLGHFYRAQPTPFVHRALGQFIETYIASHELGHKAGYYALYLIALEHLLEEIGIRGHGGTVVLVSDLGCLTDTFPRYQLQNTLQMPEAFKMLMTSGKRDASFCVEARSVLRERMNFLAQLACSDGALLLQDAMVPVAFAVTLQAKARAGDVIPGPAPYPGQEQQLDLDRLGTRHNSAADFVAAHQGSIAFVISNDGPIRAFLKSSKGPLFYWADCTLSMFV